MNGLLLFVFIVTVCAVSYLIGSAIRGRTEYLRYKQQLAGLVPVDRAPPFTSDGYHTFDELYYHRMMLFAVICEQNQERAWKSKLHDDGTMYQDYFIVGVYTPAGDYTYHYHMDYWHVFDVQELPKAPKYDGHKPSDIKRLFSIIEKECKSCNRTHVMWNPFNEVVQCHSCGEVHEALEKEMRACGILQ